MEHTITASRPGGGPGGLASAADHLRSGWEQGKEAARDVKRTATRTWSDVDHYVDSRPKTVALAALGAGLAVGFLTGVLLSVFRRTAST